MTWSFSTRLISRLYCLTSLLCLLGLSLPYGAYAQTLPLRQFSMDEGLTSNDVWSAMQDSSGYLWFATYAGISRFDGRNFVNYTEKLNGIGGNIVRKVVEDSRNFIWVAYNGGLAKLEGNKFINFTSQQGLLGKDVFDLWADPFLGLWIVTEAGVNYFDGVNFTSYPLQAINSTTLDLIQGNSKGDVFVIADNSVWRIVKKDKDFKRLENIPAKVIDISYHEEQNALYLIDENTLFRWQDGKLEKMATSPLSDKLIRFSSGKNNDFWIHSASEIWHWQGDKSTTFSTAELDFASISDVLEDHEGNVWITRWGGVSMIIDQSIRHYAQGLPGKISSNIYPHSDGTIWVSGEQGLAQMNLQGEILHKITSRYVEAFYITDNQIYSCTDEGLKIYDLKGNLITESEDRQGFTTILPHAKKGLLLGGYNGVYLWDEQTLIPIASVGKGLGNNSIWALKYDKSGDLWVGTENGLAQFDGKDWKNYHLKDGLSHQTIWSIIDNPDWGFLVGTDKGISRRTPEGFETLNVLKEETINFIKVDLQKKLWVGTPKGLYRFNLKFEKELFYDKSRGLPSNSTYTKSFALQSPYIFVGTYRGVARLDMNVQEVRKALPFVQPLETFVNQKPFRQLSKASLNYFQNNITFNFNAVYHYLPKQISYKYILEGFDAEWNPPTHVNNVTYNNLNPGEFTFRLIVLAEDGKQTSEQLLRFHIERPYWQKWWFIVFAMVLTLGSLGFLVRFLLLQAQRENEFLENQVKQRTADLQRANLEIERIHQVMNKVNETLELDEIMHLAMNALLEIFSFELITIHVSLPDHQGLKAIRYYDVDVEIDKSKTKQLNNLVLSFKEKESVFVSCFEQNKRIYIPHITPSMVAQFSAYDVIAYKTAIVQGFLCYPLMVHHEVIGTLGFGSRSRPFKLSEDELENIQNYVTKISIAINNARQVEEIKIASLALAARNQEIESNHQIIQRQNEIFRTLMEVSTQLEQTEQLERLFEITVNHLFILYPTSEFGIILNGERAEIIECAVFEGMDETWQQLLLQYQEKLLEVSVNDFIFSLTNAPEIKIREEDELNHWFILPMIGRDKRSIGKLILHGPKLEKQAIEVITLFLEQLSAVTENKLLHRQLEKIANTDSLTGAYNRGYFDRELFRITELSTRYPNMFYSIFLIDVNGLKRMNDVFGHQMGDDMIIRVAKLLVSCCRKSDIISRLGGDEFVILCPATGINSAQILLDRIRAREAKEEMVCFHPNGDKEVVPIRFSIGVASSEDTPAEEVVKKADTRMYENKKAFYESAKRYR